MKCGLFIVDRGGRLLCSNPPARMKEIGTVEDPPIGLLDQGQRSQVEAWKILAPVAAAVAPIFSVTTYTPDHIEAEVRFRVPPTSHNIVWNLDESVRNLWEDLKEAGFHAVVDVTAIGDPVMMVWKLALLSNPTKEDPLSMRVGLKLIAQAVEDTRLGEHVMDPEEDWPPRSRTDS